MIISANKGQAIGDLIEWLINLTDADLITLMFVLLISIAISVISYGFIRTNIRNNIENKHPSADVVIMPISAYVCPFMAFIFSSTCSLMITCLIDVWSPFIFCVIFLSLTIIIVCLMPKFSPFSVIRYEKNYYISRSWFGEYYRQILPESVKIEFSADGIRIFLHNKNYGMISDPGNRPWLKSQKHKYDEFKTFLLENIILQNSKESSYLESTETDRNQMHSTPTSNEVGTPCIKGSSSGTEPLSRWQVQANLTELSVYQLSPDEVNSHNYLEVLWPADTRPEIDLFAMLLDKNNQIIDDGDLVYYNSIMRTEDYNTDSWQSKRHWRETTLPMSSDGSVYSIGEDVEDEDGYWGEGMFIDLYKTRPEIYKIIFFIAVYDNDDHQTFNGLKELILRFASQSTGESIVAANLKGPFDKYKVITLCSFTKMDTDNNLWAITLEDIRYPNTLLTFLDQYISNSTSNGEVS